MQVVNLPSGLGRREGQGPGLTSAWTKAAHGTVEKPHVGHGPRSGGATRTHFGKLTFEISYQAVCNNT